MKKFVVFLCAGMAMLVPKSIEAIASVKSRETIPSLPSAQSTQRSPSAPPLISQSLTIDRSYYEDCIEEEWDEDVLVELDEDELDRRREIIDDCLEESGIWQIGPRQVLSLELV